MSDPLYTAMCSAVTLLSNRNGFFQQIIDNVMNSMDVYRLSNFQKLQTNQERILQCLKDKIIRDQVNQMMNNVQQIYRGKSALASQSRRLEAEQLHKKANLHKALIMFTQSIIKAPPTGVDNTVDDGFSLSLAFWGRSNILYKLNKFDSCLEDIKLCLKEKLPDYLKLEAYWLMAECYIHLKQLDHAKVTFNIMMKIAPQNSKDSNTWTKIIQSKLVELQQNSFNKNPQSEEKVLQSVAQEKLIEEHPNISNASSKLRITRNDYAGNYFIAAQQISTGDTLIAEYPYVSCLSSEKYGTHCQHCLQRLEIALPCTDCSAVAFCSSACRTTSLSTYHKFECHYLDLLIGSGMSILSFTALRIVSQQNIKYFLESNSKSVNKINEDYYNQVYNMVTHSDKRTPTDFLHRTLMAIFLLAVLKRSGYFQNSTIDEMGDEEILIGSILLRNLEVLQFNAHEISESVKFKSSECIKTQNIGIGLYKTASFFNHGCFPAVTRCFRGTRLIIKALRPVAEDEIVADNYGPIFIKMKLQERKKYLESRYLFECGCEPCIENWPTINDMKENELKLRCPSCKLPCEMSSEKTEVSCNKCKIPMDCSKIKRVLHTVEEILKKNTDELDDMTVSELNKNLDFLHQVLYGPHRIYFQVADKLNNYWVNSEIIPLL